jgi:hypothetical protein
MMAISTLISTFAGIAIIRLHQVAVGYLFAHIEYDPGDLRIDSSARVCHWR